MTCHDVSQESPALADDVPHDPHWLQRAALRALRALYALCALRALRALNDAVLDLDLRECESNALRVPVVRQWRRTRGGEGVCGMTARGATACESVACQVRKEAAGWAWKASL